MSPQFLGHVVPSAANPKSAGSALQPRLVPQLRVFPDRVSTHAVTGITVMSATALQKAVATLAVVHCDVTIVVPLVASTLRETHVRCPELLRVEEKVRQFVQAAVAVAPVGAGITLGDNEREGVLYAVVALAVCSSALLLRSSPALAACDVSAASAPPDIFRTRSAAVLSSPQPSPSTSPRLVSARSAGAAFTTWRRGEGETVAAHGPATCRGFVLPFLWASIQPRVLPAGCVSTGNAHSSRDAS